MKSYLEILQDKAKKVEANIKNCGYDKECITNAIASKIRSNLENESLNIILEKAAKIEASLPSDTKNKTLLLNAIEEKIKDILIQENEHFTTMESRKDFLPLDIG